VIRFAQRLFQRPSLSYVIQPQISALLVHLQVFSALKAPNLPKEKQNFQTPVSQ